MVKRKHAFYRRWLANAVSALLGLVLASGAGWAANPDEQHSEISKRFADSAKVLENVMASPKRAIPEGILHRAMCVAIFPSTVQVAVLVGGKHGKGFATCRTGDGWSAPAPLDISGGSWGAQLGGQEIDLVLLVTDEKGMQELASGKLKMGIEASIAGGPVGEHAATVTTNADILSYSRSRGLFAGTNLNGSAITEDEGDARSLYGSPLPLTEILACKTQPPDAGRTFVNEVAKYAGQSRQKE